MRNTLLKAALCLLISVVAFGCASIIGKGGPENVNIRSVPDQAEYVVFDEDGKKVCTGKTPNVVSLEKKKGYFSGKTYTIKINKAGHMEQTVTVDTTASGWYIGGNLLFGGLIGWIVVDPLTGAMWTLDANDLDVKLESVKASEPKPTEKGKEGAMMLEQLNFKVAQLDDIPDALRHKMVRISQ